MQEYLRDMRTRAAVMLLGLTLAAWGCSDTDDEGCPSGSTLATGTVGGTPTGTLPANASYGCASINPVGSTYTIRIANVGDLSFLAVTLPATATGTLVINTASAAITNVAWNQILTEGNTSGQCLTPTGTRTSNGTITVTTTPTATTAAGSFSIPQLCNSTGAVVYDGVSGTFSVP